MRCVNETLPPIVRARWALIIVRWSMTSFIGTARTLVAVGISSEMSMFFAVRRGAPRNASFVGRSVTGAGRFEKLGGCAGRYAWLFDRSGVAVAVSTREGATGAGLKAGAGETGSPALAGAAASGGRCSAIWVGAGVCAAWAAAGGACSIGGVGAAAGAGTAVAGVAVGSDGVTGAVTWWLRKKSAQVASTEDGSASYRSYISSISQSLAPKSCAAADTSWSG